jgi:hypothetical protein
MANLSISVDDKYYKADSIIHGRKIRKFFEKLTANVFHQSYRYWNEHHKLTEHPELPLCHNERNLYSIFAAAINKITPIHLSEWVFNNEDTGDGCRRPDFWCLVKNGNAGQCINYFIEIKKTYYCISDGTMDRFTSHAESIINDLEEQIINLKKIRPNWIGDGEVFLGIVVIHGYYNKNKDVGFDENTIRENIHNILDKRRKSQMLLSTWTLPQNMDVQWENDKCEFVSIAGIAIT